MSRLARIALPLPSGVTVTVSGGVLEASGPQGKQSVVIPASIVVAVDDGRVRVQSPAAVLRDKEKRALQGTIWALIRNALVGVSEGYRRQLELHGVGYRAEAKGTTLRLFLGFSHPVEVQAPPAISFTVEKNVITVSGPSKYLVGEVAASLRRLRPPEPYKGKGVRYLGEIVRRKAGKVAGAGTAA